MNRTWAMYMAVAGIAALAGYWWSEAGLVTGVAEETRQINVEANALIGKPRPEFVLPDLEGRPHGPADWSGKVLVLNFWAKWCPPCLVEIPVFMRLQEKYGKRGLQFVGIALHTPEEVREFVSTKGINYPILTGEIDVIRVAELYGNRVGALPYTVIIDRQQQVAFIRRGPLSEKEAEREINSLL